MIIPHKVNKEDAYTKIYGIINDINGWKLSEMDIKVFSKLLYTLNQISTKVNDPKLRQTMLFSKEMKKEVVESLGTTYNSFMNSLTRLRKIGLIIDNTIDEKFAVNIDKGNFKLTIQFAIND